MQFGPKITKYLEQYRAEHTKFSTRLTHMIGIPMIVASLPLLPTAPPVGVGLFAAGWALQYLGHYFEGNKPSFYGDPTYLAVGALWAGLEWAEILTGKKLLPEAGEVAEVAAA
jgi:uncharacterized membrane protein YGL010W